MAASEKSQPEVGKHLAWALDHQRFSDMTLVLSTPGKVTRLDASRPA
jgi:hypothetical protein